MTLSTLFLMISSIFHDLFLYFGSFHFVAETCLCVSVCGYVCVYVSSVCVCVLVQIFFTQLSYCTHGLFIYLQIFLYFILFFLTLFIFSSTDSFISLNIHRIVAWKSLGSLESFGIFEELSVLLAPYFEEIQFFSFFTWLGAI